MADALLYLTERDVVSVLDMRRAIDARCTACWWPRAATRPTTCPRRWRPGAMAVPCALGSVQTGEGGYAGFKTWVHTKAGGGSVFSLFDARTGFLRAVIEARALGMLRTAAISGVATRPGAAGRQPRRADRHRTAGRDAAGGAGRGARAAAGARVQPTAEKRRAFVAAASARYAFEIEESPRWRTRWPMPRS